MPEKARTIRRVKKQLKARPRKRGRIALPIVKSKQAGTLRLTNEAIYQVIPFP